MSVNETADAICPKCLDSAVETQVGIICEGCSLLIDTCDCKERDTYHWPSEEIKER